MNLFDEKNIFRMLVCANLFFLVAYLLTNLLIPIPSWTFRNWFDLDAEGNIPAWFSSMQLFFIAQISIFCAKNLDKGRLRRFYSLAAAGFIFLSIDEAAEIHEGVGGIAKKSFIAKEYFPNIPQLWMLIYPIAALILAFIFRREIYVFLYEKKGNLILFCGALVFVSGALGFEAVDLYLIPEDAQILHMIEVSFEETFEVLGQSIICYAFLIKLATIHSSASTESQTYEKEFA